jgi:hypothetical protein
MLSYLFRWEDDLEISRRDEDFKNLVFAHDLWPENVGPSLQHYKALFSEAAPTDEEVEWVTPRGQGEIAEILAVVADQADDSPVEELRV